MNKEDIKALFEFIDKSKLSEIEVVTLNSLESWFKRNRFTEGQYNLLQRLYRISVGGEPHIKRTYFG